MHCMGIDGKASGAVHRRHGACYTNDRTEVPS